MDGLPTPPNEEHAKSHSTKKSSGGSKSVKTVHRGTKRANTAATHGHHHAHSHAAAHPPSPSHDSHSQHSGDGRHKRVWKACERCRMKKTKCDGEFPCKRCKDDGLVCTAGTRKKTEYKQLPRGYAEVLENTQFALIATVHKLYAMVRNSQKWDLGEPELNERGQPVIHNIAAKLGCIRPNSDLDLPVHSVFPEDEAGLAELARQLEEQQREREQTTQQQQQQQQQQQAQPPNNNGTLLASDCCGRTERASSSELDHSDWEQDYRQTAFGGVAAATGGALTMSPQSLAYSSSDFDLGCGASTSSSGSSIAPPDNSFPRQQPSPPAVTATTGSYTPTTASWDMSRPASMDFATADDRFLPAGPYMDMDMLSQGLLESSFGTIKPHVLSCPNPEVMMGMGDPMIFSGYDPEPMRL
ncbi:hypothetical protein VTK73DRAFT_9692 [Phialemonium thermophilum]|uniref:Zn(2)-C6 fungal-type domain-containing protein n=1 Tax=Phialemonium thermophilum TaxID=223376 RepID=A0ABR3W103_9PEZI